MRAPAQPSAQPFLEPLEPRCHLSAPWGVPGHGAPQHSIHRAAPASSSTVLPSAAYSQLLSQGDVQTILAGAASQARDGQVICVADRDGHILGLLRVGPALADPALEQLRTIKAIDQAITAAFFESTQDAFTTRTARFIIQDHFPHPVPNTPGGPLYGVEFSSQPTSDVFGKTAFAISGDPGGVPLFMDGVPVGGIGVSGDGVDRRARKDVFIASDPDATAQSFDGTEERDFDEAVALAGAQGFMAPASIRADKIFVGGLRLPFLRDTAAHANAARSFVDLTSSGDATLIPFTNPFSGDLMADGAVHDGSRQFPLTTFDGFSGEVRDPVADGDPVDAAGTKLTAADVHAIIDAAVRQALITRAAIREPIGVGAVVHICVVDADGNRIGSFRMNDGTNFSYDVAVQKARTAAFFSGDSAAFSTRAIGFLAQAFFPPGIGHTGPGPLFHIQNDLSGLNADTLTPSAPKFAGVLKNGITIFPGGFPLYKDGKLVGAIGVSGDGVDQDDIIGYAGTQGFRPADDHFRSDRLNDKEVESALDPKITTIVSANGLDSALATHATDRLSHGLNHIRLPYVKFPRNPKK
jgi:uncharacterized protein GlcG (DUF336 family)